MSSRAIVQKEGRKKSFPRTNLPSASPAPAADTITLTSPKWQTQGENRTGI